MSVTLEFGHHEEGNVEKTCRICLETNNQVIEQKEYIAPCRCRGTSEFVHYICMEKWIRKSTWKHSKDREGTFILCEQCQNPIYFTIGSESWKSWMKSKPCSATFYICWIFLLLVSLGTIIFLASFSLVTKKYEAMRFMGLPLGFFMMGGFLFLKCRNDFRDYERGIFSFKRKNFEGDRRNGDQATEKNLDQSEI